MFSVVVPAYRVQAYLRAAVTSVLEQDWHDVEVIAVDDQSPDHCGAIIDELAAADDRVHAVHVPANLGLGGARTAGLDAARGEYVIFLDGDDRLSPGSLTAIADRLVTNGLPDLCIYNYARTYWDGRCEVGSGAELLASLSAGTFVPRDHWKLFNLLPIACNKAYRRDFLQASGARFGTGFYEDIPFTYAVLMQARSAVTLNRVVLDYRQRRSGSILRTPSPRHFDVFAQYDLVFEDLDRLGASGGLRRHVYDIMVNHFAIILGKADRVAPSDRQRFFAQAKQQARRHHRQDAPGRNRPSAIRGRLIREHSYRALAAYGRLNATRMRLRRLAGRVYWPTRRAVRKVRSAGRLLYVSECDWSSDVCSSDLSEYWGTGFGCNPRAVFEALPTHAPQLRPVWIITADKARQLPPGTAWVAPQSWRQWLVFARGRYFVNNVNFPGAYVKRPGQVHVQTMHGTPLKRCGLDVLDRPYATTAADPNREPARSAGRIVVPSADQVRREFQDLLRRSDRWDFGISSNPYSTETWSHAYPCEFEWLEVGYPRNDALVNSGPQDRLRARQELSVPERAICVLYAPTFREAPGDPSIRFDLRRVAEQLPAGMVLAVRAHHTASSGKQARELIEAGLILDAAKATITEWFLAADVLLTDYSSAMFDYALLDRPIVVFADDWPSYRESRGTYFDLLAGPPGPVARNEAELIDVLASGSFASAESAALRADFRKRFCVFDSGTASQAVLRVLAERA